MCFNSLQTGKCIQRKVSTEVMDLDYEFQFPSNGKVYSENLILNLNRYQQGFNSLQTGKCIQSRIIRRATGNGVCFNSLQTGKCIQRRRRWTVLSKESTKVSIPFKRESVFRELKRRRISWHTVKFQFPSNGKVYSESYCNFSSR